MPFRYKARVGAVDLQGRLLCGVASGSVAALISCPAEVTLVRLSNDGALPEAQRRNYKGVAGACCCVLCTAGVSHVQCLVSRVSWGSARDLTSRTPPHTLCSCPCPCRRLHAHSVRGGRLRLLPRLGSLRESGHDGGGGAGGNFRPAGRHVQGHGYHRSSHQLLLRGYDVR